MYEDNISEAIRYSASMDLIGGIFGIIALTIFGFIIIGGMVFLLNMIYPKSKRYRELISDLYIIAKIRQIADKENVNIDSELKVFSKLGSRGKAFDKVLEERLNEKLLEDLEEKKETK